MSRLILGIETSCDETAAAVAESAVECRSSIVYSQDIHVAYGGVVPELAGREHAARLPAVARRAVDDAGVSFDQLDGIAVTAGPGLIGCLLVGVSYARSLARTLGISVIGINHLEGHAHSPRMADPDLAYPYLCLIASGGHTSLARVDAPGELRSLGETRDDAAGEALDKVGKLIGLDYPAGPQIDRLAANGNPETIRFPRARLEPGSFDFSFSGVKTAAALDWQRRTDDSVSQADWLASFELAVVDILVEKLLAAAEQERVAAVAVAGGVAQNRRLRELVARGARARGLRVALPPGSLCGDNAAMIATVGWYRLRDTPGRPAPISVHPRWPL